MNNIVKSKTINNCRFDIWDYVSTAINRYATNSLVIEINCISPVIAELKEL